MLPKAWEKFIEQRELTSIRSPNYSKYNALCAITDFFLRTPWREFAYPKGYPQFENQYPSVAKAIYHLCHGTDGSQSFSSESVCLQALQVIIATHFWSVVFQSHHMCICNFNSRPIVSNFNLIQSIVLLRVINRKAITEDYNYITLKLGKTIRTKSYMLLKWHRNLSYYKHCMEVWLFKNVWQFLFI